jgi:hypothetical protein
MADITEWVGRLGNNILQIIRAIHYCQTCGSNLVKFPKHVFLTNTQIFVYGGLDERDIHDTFFSLKKFGISDPEPHAMRSLFRTYISPIMKVDVHRAVISNRLFIHIRSGDIFSSAPHGAYVPAPLYFYNKVIHDFTSTHIIYEDDRNPVLSQLRKNSGISFSSRTLSEDIHDLLMAENLAIGFGTFGFLIYLMSVNLKNLYIPRYVLNELPPGSWGEDTTLHIIELPNYINVGEWKNTNQQRQTILEYNPV